MIRPHRFFNANRISSLQYSDTYLSIYFRPDKFLYGRGGHKLLTNMRVLGENLNVNPLLKNNTYEVSRVTSCNILTDISATRGKGFNAAESKNYSHSTLNFAERNNQASVCIEYVDASSQTAQDVREVSVLTEECTNTSQVAKDVREVGVLTEECKDNDAYDKQSNVDSPSSRYYETSESVSMSESELGVNSDPEGYERSHKRVIIQKDSEIIVLKNELGVRERYFFILHWLI